MSNSKRLLVTGFGPFGGVKHNPSGETAKAVDGRKINNVLVRGEELMVSWTSAWPRVLQVVEEFQPHVLLCLGVSQDSFLRLETTASNIAARVTDVEGNFPSLGNSNFIIENGPETYTSTLPLEELSQRLSLPFPVEFTDDAGEYLCNYLFYRVMHHLDSIVPTRGFIHVPPFINNEEYDQSLLSALISAVEELATVA